jgi:hypothetical protein
MKSSNADALLIGRNPDPDSSLPTLLQLPVAGGEPIVLATRDSWPGPKDMFCYELDAWPPDAEVVEEVPVQACWRRGRAVHLVLRRRQRRRSMFVWTRDKQGRRLIFWRTEHTMRAARPGIRVPRARGLDRPLEIAVDSRERYAWKFEKQKALLSERRLPVGDYGVFVGERLVAAVERKRVPNLATAAVNGSLAMALADLAELPFAALVVEGRLSDVLKNDHVDSGWLLSLIVTLQTSHPTVGWTFAETRQLAQDFAYRWLAAARKTVLEQLSMTGEAEDEEAMAGDEASGVQLFGRMVYDAEGRQREAVRLAAEGRVWTSGAYAEHFEVSQTTAWKDLTTLVESGGLVAEGNRRTRCYRHPEADRSDGGETIE